MGSEINPLRGVVLVLISCCSFGHMTNPDRRKDVRPEDLAKASLVTVTNNIAAIARMCAMISVSCSLHCGLVTSLPRPSP